MREISQCICDFLTRLRTHPAIGDKAYFLPIVEVNGNEPYALSIVSTFAESPPYRNPFARAVYKSKVSSGIGVWTTRETKFSSVKTTLDVMLQGLIKFARGLKHVDNSR